MLFSRNILWWAHILWREKKSNILLSHFQRKYQVEMKYFLTRISWKISLYLFLELFSHSLSDFPLNFFKIFNLNFYILLNFIDIYLALESTLWNKFKKLLHDWSPLPAPKLKSEQTNKSPVYCPICSLNFLPK